MVKHRQLAPTLGPLANDRQKNPMAPLDDNPVLEKGVSEAAKRHEFDKFIDQLEEIEFSDLNNEARIQLEFDAIRTKTLSELEEDLEKLLEDSKQKTPMDRKTPLLNCTHTAEPSFRKKKSKTSFKKATHKKKQSKNTFSSINDIDEKVEHCLQKAEDIFSINTSRRILHLMDSQLCRTRTRSSFHQISRGIGRTNLRR